MSIFDDLKKKADANSDGRLTKEDLDKFVTDGTEHSRNAIEELKKKADANNDGKVGTDDLDGVKQSIGEFMNSVGDKFNDAKDSLFKK